MSDFLLKLRAAYESEYYLNTEMKLFSKPKIYHGGKNFDLSKRWYVYYDYRHPDTGLMVRQTPIYLDVNKNFPDKTERLRAIKIVRNNLEKLLKDGYNPYHKIQETASYSVENALRFAVELIKHSVTERTYEEYSGDIERFITYLKGRSLNKIDIKSLTKKHINDFLNAKLKESSPSTRNSYRKVLHKVYETLVADDYVDRNIVSDIEVLKAKPVKNKAYTEKQSDSLFEYLKKNNQTLLLLVQFVSFNFLRPVEACRLQVKDLDLESDIPTLFVRAKNQIQKTKIIPDMMLDELRKLDLSNPNAYLLTKDSVAESDLSPEARRHYFSSLYLKIKKELGYGEEYTIYSFRHTFITKAYRKLRETFGQFETYDKLMLITGHAKIEALKKYLREIDAELPDDYSDLLK